MTGCSFQARSAEQARVDGAVGGEPPVVVGDARGDARAIDAPPDAEQFLDAGAGHGSLTVASSNLPSGDTNLTTEGTLDWAHWGHMGAADFDHKLVGGSISDAVLTNGGSRYAFTNITTTASWTDGTPHTTVTATNNAIGVAQGNGLRFTVPAGTTPHTLRVYVGNKNSTERLDVALSDSSASAFTMTSTAGAGAVHTLYTITYSAASDNQTLTVTWTDMNDGIGGGFEMLMSATLQ